MNIRIAITSLTLISALGLIGCQPSTVETVNDVYVTPTPASESGDNTGQTNTGGEATPTADGNTGSEPTPTVDDFECHPGWEDAGPNNRNRAQEDREEKMYPGSDCMACHDTGGIGVEYDDGEVEDLFTLGGTLYDTLGGDNPVKGAKVEVTDSTGKVVTMTTNSAGNFYSEKKVVPPLTTKVTGNGKERIMYTEFQDGSCNSCHACVGSAGGKVYLD